MSAPSTACSTRTALRNFDFDIVTDGMGPVAVAGQRAARFLRLGVGGPARFAQPSRHQESGGRCADRPHHLRQGSRRTGRELQGAGSGVAVELLRRPAIRRRLRALRALGPLQPSRAAAEIRRFRISRPCGGGTPKKPPRPVNALERFFAHARSSRRHVLGLGVGALSAAQFRRRAAAAADDGTETHGMSVFGDLKYPADFHHFDYVNPAAPKGGMFSTIPSLRAYNQSFFTFNSLNAFILKGEGAQGMDLMFATLMARAGDEPDAMYGLVAKSVQISPDKLTYRFTLRPEARFHDGSKLTAHDAAFSLTILKDKGHPLIVRADARHDEGRGARRRHAGGDFRRKARARRAAVCREPADLLKGLLRDAAVRRIDAGCSARIRALQGRQVRDQPLRRIRTGQGLVGRRSSGQPRQLTISTSCATNSIATAMSPSKALPARIICFARNLPSRIWATRYDFPAVKDGRVKREVLPDDSPSGAQGWFINTRREKFRDPRVREALIAAPSISNGPTRR